MHRWRIVNPVLFRVTMRTESAAYVRLEDIIYSQLNQHIGKIDAEVLISDKDHVAAMLSDIVRLANAEVRDYGIEIIDVRIKRTDLPQENNANIFNRMRTERERMAMQYRSEGQEEARRSAPTPTGRPPSSKPRPTPKPEDPWRGRGRSPAESMPKPTTRTQILPVLLDPAGLPQDPGEQHHLGHRCRFGLCQIPLWRQLSSCHDGAGRPCNSTPIRGCCAF